MSEIIDLQTSAGFLPHPYAVTRSKLGTTTKVVDQKFICSPRELETLYESMGEKLGTFTPSKAGFQYLISFTDSTHYENNSLSSLTERISNSDKNTEKIILNWEIGHQYDGVENEMSITVRISNPMNPFVMLQAAMSSDHSGSDPIDFEDGSVSISINGATQITAEEIFSIVQRWAAACPQPQSITGLNNTIYKNSEKISFLNYWIFPVLYSTCAFFYLMSIPQENVAPYLFVAFVSFMLVRTAATNFNRIIERWAHISRRFSLFMITAGDSNQQTKIAANSKNSALKLFVSVVFSFLVNVAAGIFVTMYFNN